MLISATRSAWISGFSTHCASEAGRAGVARVEREQDLRDPPAAQLGAAVRAVAGFLASQGLGQPRREAPEFLKPRRDHPASVNEERRASRKRYSARTGPTRLRPGNHA